MAGRMDAAMYEKPLVPGFEEPHHLKVAPFVSALWEALGPLGKAQQDRVLRALAPLLQQIGASDVPSSAEGFRQKFGLDVEIKRKLQRIDYCDRHQGCGWMQLVPIENRSHAKAPLCGVCKEVIYGVSTHNNITKLSPKSCDYVIDPYMRPSRAS
jgi:hypothetical protein